MTLFDEVREEFAKIGVIFREDAIVLHTICEVIERRLERLRDEAAARGAEAANQERQT